MQINPLGAISKGTVSENSFGDSRLITLVSFCFWAVSIIAVSPVDAAEGGRRIEVGAQRAVKTLSEASLLAKDGDTVEVDAGDYLRDVAVWTQNDLTLRAKNGRARLIAQGASAESKGIWVVRGGNISVEGFDFIGATVPDHNGAGIRFEKGTPKGRELPIPGERERHPDGRPF